MPVSGNGNGYRNGLGNGERMIESKQADLSFRETSDPKRNNSYEIGMENNGLDDTMETSYRFKQMHLQIMELTQAHWIRGYNRPPR